MKGGIAAAICALAALERAGRVPACDVVFHLVADEERGGRFGTRALLEAGLIQGTPAWCPNRPIWSCASRSAACSRAR